MIELMNTSGSFVIRKRLAPLWPGHQVASVPLMLAKICYQTASAPYIILCNALCPAPNPLKIL